jgi:hypothetical protein
MPWRCTALEDLDDDHTTTTAWSGGLAGIDGGSGGPAVRFCSGEQLARAGDVVGARAFGEQAVVADAVQAFWQHVDEEAVDELEGGERHLLVSIAALDGLFRRRRPDSDFGRRIAPVVEIIGRCCGLHLSKPMKFSHGYAARSLADRFHGKPTEIEAPVCRYPRRRTDERTDRPDARRRRPPVAAGLSERLT